LLPAPIPEVSSRSSGSNQSSNLPSFRQWRRVGCPLEQRLHEIAQLGRLRKTRFNSAGQVLLAHL
jgi:hypothetical protein